MSEVQVKEVVVPVNFNPRSYQEVFLDAMLQWKKKRACLVWHRRAGKDKTTINLTVMQMLRRVGLYYYFFPTYAQGKKILWDGMGSDGFRFMDHFPKELIDGVPNETEMQVKLKNGSIFQIIGTDKIDSIVGTNPVGCVFSEYPLQDPSAWKYMSPILAENGGWAVFVFTPRGKNHAYDLFRAAQGSSEWYCSRLTVDMTFRDAEGESKFGQPVVTKAAIDQERSEGLISEALIQQEYYCDFSGVLEGAYYEDQLRFMAQQKRIRPAEWSPDFLVDTAWDLGVDDATGIVFTQTIGDRPIVIDYFEDNGKGLDHYVKVLKEKNYTYGSHYGPHDIKVQEWGSGKTRFQTAANMGLHFNVTPKLHVAEGINATRIFLARAIINEKLERYIAALAAYRREKDEKLQSYKDKPVHDWASTAADATRYRAINYHRDPSNSRASNALTSFALFGDNRRAETADTSGSIWSS